MELTLRAFPPGFQPQGQDDEAQVNTLIYTMGDEADDILRSFALSDENSKTYAYDAVLGKSKHTSPREGTSSSSGPNSTCEHKRRVSPLTP